MASEAAEETTPLLAFVLEFRIVHEGGVGVLGGALFLERDEIAGNVLGVRYGKTETGHHRHVLHLEFVSVVGALAVIQIELERQSLLLVVFAANVFFLVRPLRALALARVVDPANQVIVVGFFSHAREIGGKRSALQLVAFADGVTSQAAARLEQFLAMGSVAGFVLGQGIG